MKKLHKLLFKSFIGPLFATFFIALFILIMQFLWKQIDHLAGKGLEWEVIAELLTYASAGLVPTALPLAVLLSSIMTFGNLGENFELTAIKSSGISLQKFMKPLIILSIIFTIGIFLYSNYVIPYTNLKAMSLIYDIKRQNEELQIREGVFYNEIEGISLKISEKDSKTKLMKDIMIYDHSSTQGNLQVTTADSGYIRMTDDETKLLLTLFDGHTYQEMEEKKKQGSGRKREEYPHQATKFKKQTMLIDLKGFEFSRTDESLFSNHYQMLNIGQLKQNKDSLKKVYTENASKIALDLNKNLYLDRAQLMQHERRRYTDDKSEPKQKKNNNTHQLKMEEPDSNDTKNSKDAREQADTLSTDTTEENTLNKQQIDNVKDSIYNEVKPEKAKDTSYNIRATIDTINPEKRAEIISRTINYARRNSQIISKSKRNFENKKKEIYKHQINYHKKLTLSFACIIFFFIGAPLGSIIRKGGLGTPLVISVLLFITYYIISMTGENFAEKGVIPAYIGMWISSFLFLPLGIFLTYKATNDSVILHPDTYLNAIKKFLLLNKTKDNPTEKEKQSGK
ncbi:MAG: LptF/LptG family permease [Bacteroidales bacterium]